MLRKLLGARANARRGAVIPDGRRIYAIGDVHGCLTQLETLIGLIDDDARERGGEAELIFLGDLVDRGPDSAAVVERLRWLADERPGTRFLMGNHEEIFLSALDGDEKALRLFCRVGGKETLISYGMAADEYDALDYPGVAARMVELVPALHRQFLDTFEPMVVEGDYAFVHAGIRPGVPLAEQSNGDLRWIRSTFLDHKGPYEKVIVHGHTVVAEVETAGHRIGIDTGAYESGRLTALGLEGEERWLIQT